MKTFIVVCSDKPEIKGAISIDELTEMEVDVIKILDKIENLKEEVIKKQDIIIECSSCFKNFCIFKRNKPKLVIKNNTAKLH